MTLVQIEQPSKRALAALEQSRVEDLLQQVERWLRFNGHAGEPLELQALKLRDGKFESNFFAHASEASAVARLAGEMERRAPQGIYYLNNPIKPAVATRAARDQWHRMSKGESTCDTDVQARRVAFVDVDFERPKGTSATDVQLLAALEVAAQVYERLGGLLGGEAPLALGMSGNGGAVYVALDNLPNTPEVERLVRAFLLALGLLYGTDQVKIDSSVCDAKRLGPLWGTTKRKGVDADAERPHRRTHLYTPAGEPRRLKAAELEHLVEQLRADLQPDDQAQVDRALGREVTRPIARANRSVTGDDPFRRANECDIRETARRLSLMNGDDAICPGCGITGDTSVAFYKNGIKCLHNRCSTNAQHGFYNAVDTVIASQGCKPLQAVELLAEWFGFELPRPPRRPHGAAAPVELVTDGNAALAPVVSIDKRRPRAQPDAQNRIYGVVGGRLCHFRDGGPIILSNFSARIVEEVVADDGVETSRLFYIDGALAGGGALPRARVLGAEFSSMRWVERDWGASAILSAGSGMKDRTREAIQQLSTPAARHVYRHTGWRNVGGRWIYLYNGGAVGAEGVSVELEHPLDRLALPAQVEDIAAAVRLSLSLLDCAPAPVAFALLGAVYLAPLAQLLHPDLVLWLVGPSGSLKSELAALAQRHYGATFDRKNLPATWSSTDNAIEGRLFTLKDAVCVVDDYAPQSDHRAQQELERRAQRIVRSVGNGSGRSRLRSDLTARPDRPPRGLMISTGEDTPPGGSIFARLVEVEVDRAKLDLDRITGVQESSDRLPHAMRGYLEWLAPQLDRLADELPKLHALARRGFTVEGAHLRQAEGTAHLYVGLEVFLRFAVDRRVITAAAADELRTRAGAALREIGERSKQHQVETDPAVRWMRQLRTLVAQGAVYLVDIEEPLDRPLTKEERLDRQGRVVIGWRDQAFAYLLPEAMRREVVTAMRQAGEVWPHSQRALGKALLHRGYVVPDKGRVDHQRRLGGAKHRVLRFPIDQLVPSSVPSSKAEKSELGTGSEGHLTDGSDDLVSP